MPKIALIAAIAQNNAIGNNNKLIYWLPDDLKRFKQLTVGHPIVMGSNTFRSLPKGALPNRRNIVLSKREHEFEGAEHYTSLNEALAACKEEEIVFIIGGAMLYNTAIDIANILYLTEVKDTPSSADAFFPRINGNLWVKTEVEQHVKDEKHCCDFDFVTYIRKAE